MKFLLFNDLFPVKGFNRSVILDPNRNDYHFVFNDFYDEIIKEQPDEEVQQYCLDNELGFLCPPDLISNFKRNELVWDAPSLITNCIVNLNCFENLNFISLIEQIGCVDFIVIIENINLDNFLELIENHYVIFDRSKCIELIFRYDSTIIEYLRDAGKELFEFSKIKSISFLESPENEVIFQPQSGFNFVHCVNQTFDLIYSFENHSWEYFSSNIDFLSESLHFHTYFNRKLYIGTNGEIKNSPLQKEVFGNIWDVSNKNELKEIIQTPAFQALWSIKKDYCDICKDCELRYMCLDTRVPNIRKDKEYFFKTECNYNPYISKWKHEEGYISLKECLIVSNDLGFFIDHLKLKEINMNLWEVD